MLKGRPLYDNRADAELFLPTPTWEVLQRAIARKLNVMVTGARGSGKTTLFRQLQLHIRDEGGRVAYVDATAVSDQLEMATRIRDAIRGRPSPVVAGLTSMRLGMHDPAPPPAGASRVLHDTLEQIAEADSAVILVDASGSADAVYGVFGRMRDVLWQTDHLWVVAVDEHERTAALKPPADAFFDAVVDLEPLSSNMLVELLSRRASDAPVDVVTEIARRAAGNPREALRALNDAVVHGREVASGLTARASLQDRASRLGRPHGMLMAELLSRGQLSPSDAALQSTLGVTRGRLSQLLNELSRAELVVMDTERPGGQGRPRRIYLPKLEER